MNEHGVFQAELASPTVRSDDGAGNVTENINVPLLVCATLSVSLINLGNLRDCLLVNGGLWMFAKTMNGTVSS